MSLQRHRTHSALLETLFCLQVPANVVSAGKPELVSTTETDHGLARHLQKLVETIVVLHHCAESHSPASC